MSDRIREKALLIWEHAGLECAISGIVEGLGHHNGYVRVPDDHFAYDHGYEALNRAINVHGGLTYGVDAAGWVGFDTAHAGDYWPGSDRRGRLAFREREWTLDLLHAEVECLAEQLACLDSLPFPEDERDCTHDEWREIARQAKAWRRLVAARGES